MEYDVPIYDPVFEREDRNFYPANDPTQRLVLISQIYRDIQRLHQLIQDIPDDYGRRLLTKYAIVEWISMDRHLRRLSNEILSGKTGYTLNYVQQRSLKDQMRSYRQAMKPLQQEFELIRNKIGAHRDQQIHLKVVSEHWDNLEVDRLSEACNYIAIVYNYLRSLPVYTWTLKGEDDQGQEITAVVSPLRFPDGG